MRTTPYFSIRHRGKYLRKNGTDEGMCNETNGDCYEFVAKYLNISWISSHWI